MYIDDYEVLKVLSEELNMRKAAERLFVSQPALSQRLHSIEEKWGKDIFIRSQRGLVMTSVGEKVIDFATETLGKYEGLKDEINSLEEEVYGTLKLAVASIVGQYWLPERLKDYVSQYPYVKMSLVTGWSNEVLNRMQKNEDHIGIVRGNVSWRGNKEFLFSDDLFLVDQEIKSIEDLVESDRPFIQFKSLSNYYQEIEEWWYEHFSKPPKRTIVVDQIETCKQMARNGIGYTILPKVALNQEGHLNQIPLTTNQGEKITRDTWLIYHESSRHLKQVDAFLNYLD
ncbi:LysR family transcriptional regulator [Filobacillus milosensis]|uniref:LysR family transcriptional regulator n=1 Tax=Filobacillus milosensis TaxID=94137 RepID=A0A4Y8IL35_9BACI|nr:LysR family transcriptional regulator [Filobacillus milosensis]TFB21830.1 LysR family transcriptional regulator [Filobacillus milosensis]